VLAPAAVEQARAAAKAAARWLALVESGSASADDLARLQHWRDSHALHEQTWQRAQSLRARFASVPQPLAMASLDRPDTSRRALLKRSLAVAALLPTAWLASRQWSRHGQYGTELRTATGERLSVPLGGDGSQVQLNTASAVNLDLPGRRLTLEEGEIDVHVRGAMPFTLRTDAGDVTLNQADVCLRLEEQGCRVSVRRGTVQLRAQQGDESMLRSGQRALLQPGGMTAVGDFDVLQASWTDGVLVALNQPLAEFLRELGRYRPGILRWAPELEALRVTGTFRLEDTDRVLALLEASLPLKVQARTAWWITLLPA